MDSLVEYSYFRMGIILFHSFVNLPIVAISLPLLPFKSLMIVCGAVCVLSHVRLFAAPWTVDHQAPLSMGFFRQERWSEFPFPPPWDLPDPEIELTPLN